MSLPTPSSSPRMVLEDRLNFDATPPKKWKTALPTPPKEPPASRKRPARKHSRENKQKRVRIRECMDEDPENETEEEDPTLFEESDEDEPVDLHLRARRRTIFHARSASTYASAHSYRRPNGTRFPSAESTTFSYHFISSHPAHSAVICFFSQN